MLGAPVTVSTWWLWNQIPVTLGNLVGGIVFTGAALYAAYPKAGPVTAQLHETAAAFVPEPGIESA
jgi:formate/nitrite transporter FocA (FNT family)